MIIDSSVFVAIERAGGRPDFSPWQPYGRMMISTIVASELLIGVHRASPASRRRSRHDFVEGVLAGMPLVDFDLGAARAHARLFAELAGAGQQIGAHDLIIAATAISREAAVLTCNVRDFSRVPDLKTLAFPGP